MVMPRYVGYNFANVLVMRDELESVLSYMDEVANLPPREGMDLDKMLRKVVFIINPPRYLVTDIQRKNPNGKEQVDYTCRFVDRKLETVEGIQH